MPKIKRIELNGQKLAIEPTELYIVNADTPSEIDSFDGKADLLSANSLRVLKSYVDSAIIPAGALTFDTHPTIGSNKPVTSDGIYRFVLQAIDDYFNNKFVVLTQEEYDELEYYDPNKFYMIYEPDPVEENGN